MKVMTILGTRPEIIRLSLVMQKLDRYASKHVLVHTGQNYDVGLSDVFFQELGLRAPDYHLLRPSSSFGDQVGNMFSQVEQWMDIEQPDRVLVLGDTNSALCAVLAARKGIPVYHMEAGNRCFDRLVPEEINRKVIDAISDFNLPYTPMSRENLLREGLPPHRVWVSGNPIYEVLNHYKSRIEQSPSLERLGLSPQGYMLVTIHRAENVDDPERLREITNGLVRVADRFRMPLVCSIHPRTQARLRQYAIAFEHPRILRHAPFGLFDFVRLQQNARVVLTDSGTVQEESCLYRVPAVTVRNSTERPETVACGSNVVSGLRAESMEQCVELALASNRTWRCPEGYEDAQVSHKVVSFVLGGLSHV